MWQERTSAWNSLEFRVDFGPMRIEAIIFIDILACYLFKLIYTRTNTMSAFDRCTHGLRETHICSSIGCVE